MTDQTLPVRLTIRATANTRPGPNTVVSVDGEICGIDVTWGFRGPRAAERAADFIARLSSPRIDVIDMVHAIAAAEDSLCPLLSEGFALASAILRYGR